jgi:hypothetical protein
MNQKQRQCNDAMAKAFSSLRGKNLPDDWIADVGVIIYQRQLQSSSLFCENDLTHVHHVV